MIIRVAHIYLVNCQSLSDLQILKIFKKLKLFGIEIIFISFFLESLNSVENGSLFALSQKRNEYIGIFLFHNKELAPYRKIESMDY